MVLLAMVDPFPRTRPLLAPNREPIIHRFVSPTPHATMYIGAGVAMFGCALVASPQMSAVGNDP